MPARFARTPAYSNYHPCLPLRAHPARCPSTRAKLGKQIVDYVQNNFDNVGADFAEEALKMHYGVTEPRSIRGVSTPKEEETLKAEGIRFFKFPVPSEPSDPEAT